MPIRKLVERGSYAPETLAVIFGAFDAAWAEISSRFGTDDPDALEFARNRLAQAVLAVAKPDVANISELKLQAIAAFEQMSPFKNAR